MIMNYLFLALGFLFLGVGTVRIFFPILPTAPFLLLASFCFGKGSRRVNDWFQGTRLYQNHLADFKKDRSMTMQTKLGILIPVTVFLLLAFFMMQNIYGRITIIVLLLIKYLVFLFWIKTKKAPAEWE